MTERQDSLIERMKKQPLSFWSGLCIFAGVFSYLAVMLMIDAANMRRAEERAAQLGGAVAGGFFVLLGIVLLVLHVVRRNRR
jgi:hypothetical protein